MNQQNGNAIVSSTEVNKIPRHNKKWLVITVLIFFWPLGWYWLLKSEVFTKKTKIIISSIFIFSLASYLLMFSDEARQAKSQGFSSIFEWQEAQEFKPNATKQEYDKYKADNKYARGLGYHNIYDLNHSKTIDPKMSSQEYYVLKERQAVINEQAEEDRKLKYTIVSDEHKRNIKRTVEVELSNRTDEKTLKEIAEKIFSMTTEEYERTFIAYRLKGDSNNGYWATTHFNPDLEVKIIGSDQYTHEQVKSAPLPDGEIIGTWLANWGFERKMTAYQKNGVVYMKSFETEDGEEIEASVLDGKVKLQYDGGKKGEYYLINSDGNLEFWGENGNYYTAPKL